MAGDNIIVVSLDPGDTPYVRPPFDPEGCLALETRVCGVYEQIETAKLADSGLFVTWEGDKWIFWQNSSAA